MTAVRRRTASLDGEDWQLRPHLGLEAALSAARTSRAGGEPAASGGETAASGGPAAASGGEGAASDGAAIHAIHTAAEAAADWLPARVPGSVLDDLIRAGEVEDPYVERNSRAVEWVSERAWTYRRSIDVPPLGDGERAWLQFNGIDSAGHVFLDGLEIARHAGTFAPLEVALNAGALHGGRHELAVVVEPAPPSEPQVGRTSLVRVHKPRMSYGWDFCPRLIHQGLWQSVSLITAGPVRIADVWARPVVAEDLQSATVDVRVALDLADGWVGRVRLTASLDDGGTRPVTGEQSVDDGGRTAEIGRASCRERV